MLCKSLPVPPGRFVKHFFDALFPKNNVTLAAMHTEEGEGTNRNGREKINPNKVKEEECQEKVNRIQAK